MSDLQLPVLSESSGIDKAFEVMIQNGVSGVLINLKFGYRLVHYDQILDAWKMQVEILSDIPSDRGHFLESVDYLLKSAPFITASFRPGHVIDASDYMVRSSGYSCDGPITHYYPPQARGDTDDCVVLGCSGKVS